MDYLQIALLFLIVLLSIFLSITGVQVFFILKDLKKSLERINNLRINEPPPEKEQVKPRKPQARVSPPPRLFKKMR